MGTTYDRARLRAMTTPILEHNTREMIVQCSDSPSARAVALDLLNGCRYSVSWMVDHDRTAYLGIETTSRARLVLAFTSPLHDHFLAAMQRNGGATLFVEGIVPTFLAIPPESALSRYLASQGWV